MGPAFLAGGLNPALWDVRLYNEMSDGPLEDRRLLSWPDLVVLTGLTMSPAVTTVMPFLFDFFGGRQSARTIHFLVANLLLLFVIVHIIQVILYGLFNNMRGMITGRFAIRPEETP